ncbi:MerR family transcriptional regulator [Microbacterium sp.]|uniref:MerR family transcriptional regulator n=1 Tax=Microbacterium sp. TaxID=51671 RepID=UPI0033424032
MAHERGEPPALGRLGPRLPLQTIGEFSRSVGLSPSTLRDYGASGLLPPFDVEDRTGYRYYDPGQQRQAIWIRRLRDAGLGLERIGAVLAGDIAEAETLLAAWVSETRDRAATTKALADDFLASLRANAGDPPARRTRVRCDAMVLAAAIRQVEPVSSSDPDLDGVLIEVGDRSLTISATDRFVLLARAAVPAVVEGPPARLRLSAAEAVSRLRSTMEADLTVLATAARVPGEDATLRLWDERGAALPLLAAPDRFPSSAALFDAPPPRTALRFVRRELRAVAATTGSGSLFLTAEAAGSAGVRSGTGLAGGAVLGDAMPGTRELSAAAVTLIADAAVGDELVCALGGGTGPLRWSAPAQPDFIALMMSRPA